MIVYNFISEVQTEKSRNLFVNILKIREIEQKIEKEPTPKHVVKQVDAEYNHKILSKT